MKIPKKNPTPSLGWSFFSWGELPQHPQLATPIHPNSPTHSTSDRGTKGFPRHGWPASSRVRHGGRDESSVKRSVKRCPKTRCVLFGKPPGFHVWWWKYKSAKMGGNESSPKSIHLPGQNDLNSRGPLKKEKTSEANHQFLSSTS